MQETHGGRHAIGPLAPHLPALSPFDCSPCCPLLNFSRSAAGGLPSPDRAPMLRLARKLAPLSKQPHRECHSRGRKPRAVGECHTPHHQPGRAKGAFPRRVSNGKASSSSNPLMRAGSGHASSTLRMPDASEQVNKEHPSTNSVSSTAEKLLVKLPHYEQERPQPREPVSQQNARCWECAQHNSFGPCHC